MQAAMASLPAGAVIGLDATAAGRPVYQRLGFTDRQELRRLILRPRASAAAPASGVRAMRESDLSVVTALDAQAFGSGRGDLLRWLHRHHPGLAWVATGGDGTVRGCLLGRPGSVFTQLGPVVAPDPATAQALVASALGAGHAGPVGLDAVDDPAWCAWLGSLGFVEERRFTRMLRSGRPIGAGLWAIAGPELG
jgi:hypothetical protein